jgi:hypothetical protein
MLRFLRKIVHSAKGGVGGGMIDGCTRSPTGTKKFYRGKENGGFNDFSLVAVAVSKKKLSSNSFLKKLPKLLSWWWCNKTLIDHLKYIYILEEIVTLDTSQSPSDRD